MFSVLEHCRFLEPTKAGVQSNGVSFFFVVFFTHIDWHHTLQLPLYLHFIVLLLFMINSSAIITTILASNRHGFKMLNAVHTHRLQRNDC